MARIEWTRCSPDEVEALLGILLCREYPNAQRIRPSRGDGGVDVYVPTVDGWIVYQIKSFTGRLTSSQKRQVRSSWESFLRLVEERNVVIKAWFAVRPENPTHEDEAWLETLTAKAGWDCAWRGLDFCDGLAAKCPEVVDYYLHDGRERLQSVLERFLSFVGVSGHAPLSSPVGTIEALGDLHSALNALDPHFRYDFDVRGVADGAIPPVTQLEPGLIAAATRSDGVTAVTFRIFARFREATVERPIPIGFRVTVDPDSPIGQAFQDFLDYGLPVDDLPVTALHLDLPGGLRAEADAGVVKIGPAQIDTAKPLDLQMTILDPDENLVASTSLNMDAPTTGVVGEGVAQVGREAAGVFEAELRINFSEQRFNLGIRSRDLTGLLPGDVLPGLRTLAAFRPPNSVVVALRNGPDLGAANPIPHEIGDEGQALRLVMVCEALATIQRHTFTRIAIPDLTAILVEDARDWIRAAQLLDGETLRGTWNNFETIQSGPPVFPLEPTNMFAIAFTEPLTVSIADAEINLGEQVTYLAAARLEGLPEDVDGGTRFRLVPAGNDTLTTRLHQGEIES